MTKRFEKLTANAMRTLPPRGSITEGGIRYEKLSNGDGRFSVAFRVDGSRIHRTVGLESNGVTRRTAEEVIYQCKSDARHDRLNLPKARKRHMDLEEAANSYLDKLKASNGKNIKKKESHFKNHLIPFFGKHSLKGICETEIGRYRKARKEAGAAIATINREIATLSHLLSKAVDWGWISSKPRKMGLMKENNARNTALSPEESDRLLKAAQKIDHQLYLFVKIGLSTGMRHMEILSIALENIHIQEQRIWLPKTKTGPRMQTIPAELASFLKTYLKVHCKDGQQWLFPTKTQTRTGHRTSIDDAFRTAVKNAGLDDHKITPHVMRHTVETRLAEKNVDLKTRMEYLGHKTPTMALRYDQITDQRIRSAADLLETSSNPLLEVI